jgi:hypothetical protein
MEESQPSYKEEIDIKSDMEFSSCTPEEDEKQGTRKVILVLFVQKYKCIRNQISKL